MAPDQEQLQDKDKSWEVPKRYVLVLMAFLGFVMDYAVRININIAIVSMVNQSAIPHVSFEAQAAECGFSNSSLTTEDMQELQAGEFAWDEDVQTLILSSFYWGYVVTVFPAGIWAEKLGGKNVLGFGILIGGILQFAAPMAARLHFIALIVQRGVVSPAFYQIVARWAPPTERSRMNSWSNIGSAMGTVLAIPLGALIIKWLNWESVFYFTGGMTVLWFIGWYLVVHESPAVHPKISKRERSYIEVAIGPTRSTALVLGESVAWREMMKSKPLWALTIAMLCNSWGFSVLLSLLPTYMNNVLHFDIAANGVLSALPYLCQVCFGIALSHLADWMLVRRILHVTTLRKIMNTLSHLGAGALMIGLSFAGCDPRGTVILLMGAVGVTGANYSGYGANLLDLAPNFAGIVSAVTHVGFSFVSMLAPIVSGAIINGEQTLHNWSIVFQVAAGFYLFDVVIFLAWASGEEQPWNRLQLSKSFPEDEAEDDLLPEGKTEDLLLLPCRRTKSLDYDTVILKAEFPPPPPNPTPPPNIAG
ncbi:unnamed protein product [Darwinula stevensoni]|uniref:Major facilitator superfamily (MFS) profile domain-containing protein n=1 Tax=Darwinula stevensoni TaxID=69355 RepID=A0A7R8X7P3_9CRUS|nr:unnamed protein product [Darwinula stevensoni]CAG0880736.1 unnamed protein product [Darwinula stevensoni]